MPAERRTIVVTGAAGFVGFHLAHRLDDIVEALVRVTDRPAAPNSAWSSDAPDPGTSAAPYRIYNIGNHAPVKLTEFIVLLEKAIGKKQRSTSFRCSQATWWKPLLMLMIGA